MPLHPLAAALLEDIFDYWMMTGKQLYKRHFSHLSKRRAQQVLGDLVTTGHLEPVQLAVYREVIKPRAKRNYMPLRLPRLYFGTERGAEALASVTGDLPRRVHRSSPRADTIRHRYHMAESLLWYTDDCLAAGLPSPRRLYECDMRSDLGKKVPPNQRSILYHAFQDGDRKIGLCPDAATLQDLPQLDGSTVSLLAAWETDLASEGLKQLQRTKPRAYELLHQNQDYRRYWSTVPDLFRILWVVPSRKRIETILAAFARYDDIRSLCRFLVLTENDLLVDWDALNIGEPCPRCKKTIAEGHACKRANIVTDPVWYNPVTDTYTPIV